MTYLSLSVATVTSVLKTSWVWDEAISSEFHLSSLFIYFVHYSEEVNVYHNGNLDIGRSP